jgi:hypothetical protein
MPFLYGLAILAVFVGTVAVIAVKAGTSSAIVTAVLTVAVAGTAFGLWGAAIAVKETGASAPITGEPGTGDASVPADVGTSSSP